MKIKTTGEMHAAALQYNWSIDDAADIVCGEFLFQYGEYDDVTVSKVTQEHIDFTFHNEFAGNITLRLDRRLQIWEVK